MIMNKNETDIGDSRETCSMKPDGHIKQGHVQIFLASSACVVSLAAHLNMKLMKFR